ncbi:TonB-dependent receptor domain-containing protein [Echinimonas agarilytica]|uniref:TonB-dependent receptor n=1 Tax=Echinimonas agarilytica TaxID=1215918 RepID=A0AA41W739_9GAMM|nr:TonB-dependent receptor [Echinimonas agarilytica]MCM2679821.1 TonB-dependent receptor [Echinimonas agarilytica]
MFASNKLAKAVRFAVISGAAASAMVVAPASFAQDGADVNAERIQVTGSRIKRTDMETPVPVTTISRDDIVQLGALNVADILKTSPVTIAGTDSSNSAFTNSSVGLNTTELRGLGEERTLVLVNGRRFVSGVSPSVGYAVDLNAIPASMVERIDILKSASSAVYGSDAVAGVVNIITRQDFEGVEVNVQAGTSGEGDRDTGSFNIVTGGRWDTGNAWVSLGYDEDDGLKSTDRDFSKKDIAWGLDDEGNEAIVDLFSSYPPQGRVSYTSKTRQATDANGDPAFNEDGTPRMVSVSLNGDGTPFDNRFNRAEYRQLITPLERKYAAAGINLDISPNVSVFTELNYNNAKTTDSTIEPTPLDVVNDVWLKDRNGTGGMDVNSPLLPDTLRDQLMLDGITNLNETTFVRRQLEFGARSTNLERDTIRLATGLDWDIDGNWISSTYVTWGKTDQVQENGGQVNVERAALALDVIEDADGNLICADEHARLQGCVPLNYFGEGTVSDAAVDYIQVPAKVSGQVEQTVVATGIAGDLPFELSGGLVAVAAGIEWREEKGSFNPGDLAQTGASSTNKSEPTDGRFDTTDIYGEVAMPILDNLSVDLAARYSDHSIVGGNVTWNAGVEYTPIDSLKIRASAATAIRTPNISELFGGRGETFAGVTDPCSGLKAGDTGQVAVNCLSIPEVADRVAREGVFELTQAELQGTGGFIGGNEEVQEETSDSWSVGFIWQAMDNLAFTVDYWDYSIEDAILTTPRTTVLDRCFALSSADFSQNCNGNAIRDAQGALIEVNSGTSNENNLDTSGIDFEANHSIDIGPGTLSTQAIWTYTREYVETEIESGSSIDYVGEVLNPRHRANLNLAYTMDNISVAWRARYWDHSVDSVSGDNVNFYTGEILAEGKGNELGSVTYHDLSGGYYFDNGIELNAGVRNLFDKQPNVLPQGTSNGSTGINTASEAYDVTGRYFYAGVTAKF